MIASPLADIAERAALLAARLGESGLRAEVIEASSTVGGGSLPGATLPTMAVAVTHSNVEALSAALRASDQPVVGRISEGRLLLDPRTVLPEQEESLLESVITANRNL
jgi:L-seryl-tRNA(Ser) seleniumtransferase